MMIDDSLDVFLVFNDQLHREFHYYRAPLLRKLDRQLTQRGKLHRPVRMSPKKANCIRRLREPEHAAFQGLQRKSDNFRHARKASGRSTLKIFQCHYG